MDPWRRFACHIMPILCALVLSYVAIQLLGNRYNPRTIIEQHITPDPVARGSRAFLIVRVKDDRQCSGLIHRWLSDRNGSIYGLPDAHAVYGYVTPGVSKPFRLSHQIDIPPDIAPGPAEYHSQVERWCNPFQEYVWPMGDAYTVKFTVSDKPVVTGPVPQPPPLDPR
jgi:hypothetical protein